MAREHTREKARHCLLPTIVVNLSTVCQQIYISSKKELPEIPWNEASPGFYLIKVERQETLNMLKPILNSAFIYEALSHMGCSCGLCYAESFKEEDNYPQRVQDVQDFANYLETHKRENRLQLFTSLWDEFHDSYPQKEFRTSEIDKIEFYLDEMVVLNVV